MAKNSSFTDSRIADRPVTSFWYGPSGTPYASVSVSGNTLYTDGSGNGGTLVYGVSGGGPAITNNGDRAGFRLSKDGLNVIDETLYGWHLVAKGTVGTSTGDPPVLVPHPPGQAPLIAFAPSYGKAAVIGMSTTSGGTSMKLTGAPGTVKWYAFGEYNPASNYSRGLGVRWSKDGVVLGDTSVPSLRIVRANVQFSAGGFANGNNSGDQVINLAAQTNGKKYAVIISNPGFHFDSSGQFGSGQTTTKCIGAYLDPNGIDIYGTGVVYSTSPGGSNSPTLNVGGTFQVIDVTGFDEF
ncbi:hypothetical protein [Sphingomonas aerophila]|uniref:Uncharacterized protein n=1 Tax=Sphingomonas aerophila TaxID=1344948 RepID=A0A7W9BEN1_9SPHN|nr:hypothetical protein [Sphingomonas aerophila]MBB5715839.1 hypothetical protein [Sphingomonas aerophila]